MKPKYKIFLGTTISVIIYIFSALLILVLITNIFSSVNQINLGENISGIFLLTSLLYFPLRLARKLKNKGLLELENNTPVLNHDISINFSYHLTKEAHKKLTISLITINPFMIYATLMGAFLLISSLFSGVYFWLVPALFLVIYPVLTITRSGVVYKQNKALNEKVGCEINSDNIILQGETYNTTIAWKSLYKVTELKDFLLLYTSKQTMIPIIKAPDSLSESKNMQLRSLILEQPKLIKELRQIK